MAIVSVAIMISFHLKQQPTAVEKRVALPFGIIFWLLALACLGSGLSNYIRTVTRYSKRQALVQSGWKTQMVSFAVLVACGSNYLLVDAELTDVRDRSLRLLLRRLWRLAFCFFLRMQERDDFRIWTAI